MNADAIRAAHKAAHELWFEARTAAHNARHDFRSGFIGDRDLDVAIKNQEGAADACDAIERIAERLGVYLDDATR